jgi:acyl dehydratase
MAPYGVEAFNIAAALENKIHEDSVAGSYGFSGALVPGTAVFGYMAHQPVALWGPDWLAHGAATCRFSQPVYAGKLAQVSAQHGDGTMDDGTMEIEVNSEGRLCATGSASRAHAEAVPLVDAYRLSMPPALNDRPAADPQSLAPGVVLCTSPYVLTPAQSVAWLAELRETDPLYARAGLLHPATLLRLCNWTLMQNVALGPWIHTESQVRNFHAMPVGASLVARGLVLRNWEHKGHRLVELDVLVVIDGSLPAARITHTAIYQPRPVTPHQNAATAPAATAAVFTSPP